MKGVDTNVLVRIFLDDDAEQAQRARFYVAENAPCWLNRIVLCETVWVLERLNGFSKRRIALALRQVLDTSQFEIEDADAMQSGIAALEEGFDFADAVIAATNRSRGCDVTGTFDRKAARLPGFEAV